MQQKNEQKLKSKVENGARISTYTANFYKPAKELGQDKSQSVGTKMILNDFKTLGFRRKPNEACMRQKSYELSKTAIFQSSFNTNLKEDFIKSYNQGYQNHRSAFSQAPTHNQSAKPDNA